MGAGLKRVAKQCGGLTVKAGGKTVHHVVAPELKTKAEIEAQIKEIKQAYQYVLTGELSNCYINAPRALMQADALARLSVLHWVLGLDYKSQLKSPKPW